MESGSFEKCSWSGAPGSIPERPGAQSPQEIPGAPRAIESQKEPYLSYPAQAVFAHTISAFLAHSLRIREPNYTTFIDNTKFLV